MGNARTGLAGLMMCLVLACGSATDPGLAGANGTNGTNGTVVTTCEDNSQCPLSAPICGGDGTCGDCTDSGQCESASGGDLCSEEGPTAGTCVFCVQDTDCTDRNRPLCEENTGTCRGCVDHDECASGVCDKDSATCVDDDVVVYVDNAAPTDNPDTSQCTREAPCQRLQFAIQDVVGGERRFVVLTANEEPYRSFLLLAPGDETDGPLVIIAGEAVFDWNGDEFGGAIAEADSVIIEGGTWINSFGTAFFCNGGEFTLRDAVVANNGTGIAANNNCDRLTVSGVEVDNNQNEGIQTTSSETIIERSFISNTGQTAVLIDNAPRLVMRNNILAGNSKGPNAQPVVQFSAPADSGSQPWVFVHNTIVDSFSPPLPTEPVVDCQFFAGTLIFVGNIIANSKMANPTNTCGEGPGAPPPDRIISHNILENPAAYTPPPDSILLTPMFVDPSNRDFTLQPSSPGIDDANFLNSPPDDFNGTGRFLGDAPDIGAVESN